jgi:hypothetical protein
LRIHWASGDGVVAGYRASSHRQRLLAAEKAEASDLATLRVELVHASLDGLAIEDLPAPDRHSVMMPRMKYLHICELLCGAMNSPSPAFAQAQVLRLVFAG